MARAIWSGSISFGLVTVPVKLYAAISPSDVRFHQLKEGTGARIRHKRVSSETGEEVPYERIAKGYEIAPDRYVVIAAEELEALDPEATYTIAIEDFVARDQIDPILYARPYYLVPDRAGSRAYALLREAMRGSQTVAIARMVLRARQHLVAIRPAGPVLCLATMFFSDQVIPPSELEGLPGPETEVSGRELTMARQLIASLSADFAPERYHDEYRQRVLALIEQKAEGGEIVETPAPDLAAALAASLAAAKARRSAREGGSGAG